MDFKCCIAIIHLKIITNNFAWKSLGQHNTKDAQVDSRGVIIMNIGYLIRVRPDLEEIIPKEQLESQQKLLVASQEQLMTSKLKIAEVMNIAMEFNNEEL